MAKKKPGKKLKTFRVTATEAVARKGHWLVRAASVEEAKEKFHAGDREFDDSEDVDGEVLDIVAVVEVSE